MAAAEETIPFRRSNAEGGEIKALCEAIWRIERDLGLLERTVGGVHYWPIVRLNTFFELARARGAYEQPPQPDALGHRLRFHLSAAIAGLPHLLFGPTTHPDTAVVASELRDQRAGLFLPIHGACLEKDPEAGRLLVYFRPTPQRPSLVAPQYEAKSLAAAIEGGRALGLLGHTRFIGRMRQEKAMLDEAFLRTLEHPFPFSARKLAAVVSVFSGRRRLMRVLLGRLRVRRLFAIGNNCMEYVTAAAQDVGMDVCELQHGLITRYHMGYSYPGRPVVPYAPDRLLLFGRYWKTAAELPGNTEPVVVGCRYLARYLSIPLPKVPRQVVVISQGAIGTRLFEAVLAIAHLAPDWQFIFRCHPGEQPAAYEARLSASEMRVPNLSISPNEDDFSELLARSEVQIGVFSTGLFEGMRYGNRTILLDLPGIEYMQDVIDQREAVVARTAAEIPSLLPIAPPSRNPEDYYSEPVESVTRLFRELGRTGKDAPVQTQPATGPQTHIDQ
jgi:hypothetical protein